MIERNTIHQTDCLEFMRSMPDDSVDLVLTSPPYEAARTYGVDFKLRGEAYVAWAAERFRECVRVCRGLVVWVIEGQTRQHRYSATPALLMADLHRSGINLRKPAVFFRYGIPGSGGRQWLRNDWEFQVVASKPGHLPWANNTACGHPPKYAPGGEMSNRTASGARVNQWGSTGKGIGQRKSTGERDTAARPSHQWGSVMTWRRTGSGKIREMRRSVPVLANPGNVHKYAVGGRRMGSLLAHDNEAPFPEALARFWILSYGPPGGLVFDPFCGSGTTLAVAKRHGRDYLGCDIRQCQVDLSGRRVAETECDANA